MSSKAKYKIKRKWPEAIFSGSLVQQDHGEDLEHGYYEWDLSKERPEADFVEVSNEYGYYTLFIENGVIPILSDIPEKPRLRLKVSNTGYAELKRVKTDLRRVYDVQEIIDNRVSSDSSEEEKVVNIGDISSLSYQNELIVDYAKRNFGIDDDMLTKIQSINRELNEELDEENLSKSIEWKPKKFHFSNMFSYGEGNTVDFSKMNDIMGIFAKNASGKSSLFGSLCYCLFDKAPRASRSVNVLNTDKDWFECELLFEINGKDYVINRRGEREASGRVPVDVDFYRVDNGSKKVLNGKNKWETDDIIRRYVGEYEDFILTTLSTQKENTVFIDKTQSKRKDVLAKFIGIDVFEELYSLAREESKELKTLIKNFEDEELSERAAEAEKKHEEYLRKYEEFRNKKERLLEEKSEYVDEVIELNKSLIDIPDRDLDIDELKSKLENVEENISSEKEDLKNKKIKRKEKEQAKRGLEEIIVELDKEELKNEYEDLESKKEKVSSLEDRIEFLESSLEKNISAKEHLEEHSEFDPDCEYCVERNKRDVAKLGELKNSIDKEKQELEEKRKKLSNYQEEVKESRAVERWDKYKALENKIDKYDSFISDYNLDISMLENKIDSLKNKKRSIESDIELYHEIEESLKHNKNIKEKIENFEEKISNIKEKVEELREKIQDVHGSIKVQESKKQDINERIEKFQELSNEFEAYDYYLSAVKRDGIPYELIRRSLPEIEEEVNNILSQIVSFSIVFDTDADGKKINGWMVSDEDKIVPIDNASGMEGFVSSLAIRVALTNISNLPHSNFLAIDEGFGVLDSDKRNSLMKVFEYFKDKFSFVLFVTHLDSLRDISDGMLEIRKEGEYSKVNFDF